MQINWFTVIAQVLNFLLLVWLLRRFLYKPILDAIDERERKITSQLNDAEALKAEALKEKDEFIYKNELFDQQKIERMNDAISEVKETKHKLLEEARNEANTLRTKLETTYKAMLESAQDEIALRTQEEVFAIVRKALTDLSTVSLEEQVIIVFTSKLKDLKGSDRKRFIEAFEAADKSIQVLSAFELSAQQKLDIGSVINETLSAETKIQFKTSPKLIGGIELTTNGFKLAWSISEYLNSLEDNIYKLANGNQVGSLNIT